MTANRREFLKESFLACFGGLVNYNSTKRKSRVGLVKPDIIPSEPNEIFFSQNEEVLYNGIRLPNPAT
jgi:hypothetical protein